MTLMLRYLIVEDTNLDIIQNEMVRDYYMVDKNE